VAIKVLKPTYAQHPEAIGRFYQEARVASDIKHPFIVDILDFGTTTDGAAYYAMELLSGRTLADAIDDRELPVAETCHVLRQACAAAYASHQAGVIHRDIKPANIFLVDQGDDRIFVKLLDYGLAKLTRPTSSLKTTPRRPIGTPHYMSPEQVAGDPELGPSADVYSIGVVMYELLTGRLPFDLPTTAEVLHAQIASTPVPPHKWNPRIPTALEAVCMQALEKEPARRFESAQALADAISEAASANTRFRSASPLRRPRNTRERANSVRAGGRVSGGRARGRLPRHRDAAAPARPTACTPRPRDVAEVLPR